MEFTQSIQAWVAVDNQIKKCQEEIKRQRTIRNELAESILTQVETSNMKHRDIKITDGRLRFQETRVVAPLTFRFLEKCLNECIPEEQHVKQIIKYIKNKREVKYVPDIKRTYTQRV